MAETYYSLTDIVKLCDNLVAAMPTSFYSGIMTVRTGLANIPAADVVARDCYDRLLAENDELRKERPVVRCKDCTHSRKGKASLECEKHAYVWDKRLRWVDDNDFCCWGVRKDGDANDG